MTDEIPTRRAGRSEPLSALWRVLAAPQPLMVLLGLIALAVVLGTLIPQIPLEAKADPQAWLALQAGVLSGGNALVRALHLYDLQGTLGFRFLLALTGVILLVWIVESAGLAWYATRQTGWPAIRHRRQFTGPRIGWPSTLSAQEASSRIQAFLVERGFHCTDLADDPGFCVMAVRRAFGLWLPPLAYAGLLVALAGVAVSQAWGWQSADWMPAPGESRAVVDGGHAVRLDRFDLRRAADGQLLGYSGQVTWLQDGNASRQSDLSSGRPARNQGLSLWLVGYVPDVLVRGHDQAGRPLVLQAEGQDAGTTGGVEILFPTPDAEPLLFLPGQELFVALGFDPSCSEGGPALRLALLAPPSASPAAAEGTGVGRLAVARLHESGTVTLAGLRIQVEMAYRPILRLAHRPAMGVTIGGLLVAVAALAAGWLLPGHLIRVSVGAGESGSVLVEMREMAAFGGSGAVQRLAEGLRGRLGDGS